MQETGNNIAANRRILDDSFQEEIPELYDLHIFISATEIACAIALNSDKKFIGLESFDLSDVDHLDAESLAAIRTESKLLSLTGYRNVICCSGYLTSILVPNPLFDPASAEDQLSFSNTEESEGQLLIDELHQLEARNVFKMPHLIYHTITSWFQWAEFHHISTALIEYLISANRNSNEELMLINVQQSIIEIVVTNGRKLLLYNHYQYNTPEEMVYYILFVCEQLHLNPEHINVKFAGEIQEADSGFQLLDKYVRNTGMAIRPEIYSYSEGLRELAGQLHFNLFSQVICVS